MAGGGGRTGRNAAFRRGGGVKSPGRPGRVRGFLRGGGAGGAARGRGDSAAVCFDCELETKLGEPCWLGPFPFAAAGFTAALSGSPRREGAVGAEQ